MSGKKSFSLFKIFSHKPSTQGRSKATEDGNRRDGRQAVARRIESVTTSKSTAGSSTDAGASLTTKTEPVPSVIVLRPQDSESATAPSTKAYLQMLEGHSSWALSVTFSHDDELLASASDDGTVKIWDVSSGTCLRTLEGHSSAVKSVAFSHDGKQLASASSDDTIKIWDANSGICHKTLEYRGDGFRSVSFSHHGKVASASKDGTVKIWDVSSGTCLKTFEGHNDTATSVSFSHDDKQVVSSHVDGIIKIWDASSGICLKILEDHSDMVLSVAFSHDGKQVASASTDCTIKIWDASSGAQGPAGMTRRNIRGTDEDMPLTIARLFGAKVTQPVLGRLTMPTSIGPPCTMCALPGIHICSGCRSSRYCSIYCRDADWITHSLLCHSFKDFITPPLSNDRNVRFKRAILFRADAETPCFVWLKCTRIMRGTTEYKNDDADSMLGDSGFDEARILLQENLVREKELDHIICIIHRDSFIIDGSRINRSIVEATQGSMTYSWSGNIVVARFEGVELDTEDHGDMTMDDFRHAVDYFSCNIDRDSGIGYGINRTLGSRTDPVKGQSVQVVYN